VTSVAVRDATKWTRQVPPRLVCTVIVVAAANAGAAAQSADTARSAGIDIRLRDLLMIRPVPAIGSRG
jgi:hypothetical protein